MQHMPDAGLTARNTLKTGKTDANAPASK